MLVQCYLQKFRLLCVIRWERLEEKKTKVHPDDGKTEEEERQGMSKRGDARQVGVMTWRNFYSRNCWHEIVGWKDIISNKWPT